MQALCESDAVAVSCVYKVTAAYTACVSAGFVLCTTTQVYCALCAFMVGWHVHEKAVLTALLPLCILATTSQLARHLYVVLSTAGMYALLPLLPHRHQCVTRTVLFIASVAATYSVLDTVSRKSISSTAASRRASKPYSVTLFNRRVSIAAAADNTPLSSNDVVEKLSLVLFANLHLFNEVVHPLMFGHWSTSPDAAACIESGGMCMNSEKQWISDMPFLPLMLTSVCCAGCMCYCWALSLKLVLQQR
jgi:ALG6, ALG8 glycosyltransferase family